MQEPESPIKSRFGSQEASAMYARLQKIAVENKILKVYDIETAETEISILLFNSFKLSRNLETEAISVFERDYATGRWEACDVQKIMTVIPVWPIQNLKRALATAVKGYLLKKIYQAADFDNELERVRTEGYKQIEHLEAQGMKYDEAVEFVERHHPDVERMELARRVFADRLFGNQWGRKGKPVRGFVSHDAVYSGLKGLRAAFFNHFRDPELFRAILSMNHKGMTLADYLYFGRNRSAVLKVWSERRNLMPVLPYIAMDLWGEDELFSVENWMPNGMVARNGFSSRPGYGIPSQATGSTQLIPFSSCRAFKWLSRSKNSVVKAWAQGRCDPRVPDMMAEMNLPKETAVLVVAKTVSELSLSLAAMDRFGSSVNDRRQQLIWMHRAYAAHWTGRRREVGYRPMIQEMFYQGGTSDVLDYLINHGFENNVPARNATWASLDRRSAEWHATQAALWYDPLDYDFNADTFEKYEWESLVGPMEVDGCLVHPLTDVRSVVAEGRDMGHCVGSYAVPCSKDLYRVFSIVESDGTKSTLGISLGKGAAKFDQVRGVRNGPVSERVRRLAEYVTSMYAQAIYDAESQHAIEAEAA